MTWYKIAQENYEDIYLKDYVPNVGSCMLAAEVISKELLNKGINSFTIVEGYITFANVDWNETHTWIELDDGSILDPTKGQWGIDVSKMIYIKRGEKRYSPQEYMKMCEKFPEHEEKYRIL